eukprot:Sspe_Gene.22096::Locus_8356_Transcript_1_1_Confidence_1.000_Length_6454::g.22096::m.22096/K04854/CACNA1G; voltage-dependent calcium channel T type alpha-1G
MSLVRLASLDELLRAHRVCVIGENRQDDYNCTEQSLGCLPASNPFRRAMIRLMDHPKFDPVILTVIMLNCITLAMADPSLADVETIQNILNVAEYFFLIIFTLEASVKIIALGLVLHRGSYLRGPWNVLDFLVVVAGFIQTGFGGDGQNLTMLRALRICRPLRMAGKLKQMRLLMATLGSSLPMMVDVFVLLGFLVWVFAILGLQLWSGALHYRCYVPAGSAIPLSVQSELSDGERGALSGWLSADNQTLIRPLLVLNDSMVCGKGHICEENHVTLDQECMTDLSQSEFGLGTFDNIFQALLLVLKDATLDDWPQDMANFQQRSGHVAWVYWGFLTLLGNYFVFNLVLAILSDTFSREREEVPPLPPPKILWLRCHHTLGASVLVCLQSFVFFGLYEKGVRITLIPRGHWDRGVWIEERKKKEPAIRVCEDEEDYDEEDDADLGELESHLSDCSEGQHSIVPPSTTEGNRKERFGNLYTLEGRRLRLAYNLQKHLAILSAEDTANNSKSDYVQVFVHCGRRLIACDKESSDPYVVIEVEIIDGPTRAKLRKHTATRNNTLDPIWNEPLKFEFPGMFTGGACTIRVTLTVFDQDDRSNDDFMGMCQQEFSLEFNESTSRIDFERSTLPLCNARGEEAGAHSLGALEFSVSVHDHQDDQDDDDDDDADSTTLADAPEDTEPTQELRPCISPRVRKSMEGQSINGLSPRRRVSIQVYTDSDGDEDNGIHRAPETQEKKKEFEAVMGLKKGYLVGVSRARQRWIHVVYGQPFQFLFLTLTFINVIALALDSYPERPKITEAIYWINLCCTIGFIVEAVIKIAVMRTTYFRDPYNVFDFVIVLLSIPDFFPQGPNQRLNVLRVFRLLRAFRLLNNLHSLRTVIWTILVSLRDVAWLSLLILLFIFIYGVLGMNLFGTRFEVPPEDYDPSLPYPYNKLARRDSFASFVESCITVFVLMTGEGWGSLMWLAMDRHGPLSCLYFVSSFMLGNCILLNLFVAILVNNCDRCEQAMDRQDPQQTHRSHTQDALELERVILERETGAAKACGAEEATTFTATGFRKVEKRAKALGIADKARSKSYFSDVCAANTAAPSAASASADRRSTLFGGRRRSSLPELEAFEERLGDRDSDDPFPTPPGSMYGIRDVRRKHVTGEWETNTHVTALSVVSSDYTALEPAPHSDRQSEYFSNMEGGRDDDLPKEATETEGSDSGSEDEDQSLIKEAVKEKSRLEEELVLLKKGLITVGMGGGGRGAQYCAYHRRQTRKLSRAWRNQRVDLKAADFGPMQMRGWLQKHLKRMFDNWANDADAVPLTGKSLNLFSKENRVRVALSALVQNKYFSGFITFLIFLNAVLVSLNTPEVEDKRPDLHRALQRTDIAFALLFLAECLFKIIVFGFKDGDTAYCKDTWNVVDMIVALTAFVGIFVPWLKMFRALRTIRLIVRLIEVRRMVEWLFVTLSKVANTVELMALFILIWAILGVQLFKGTFYYCSNELVSTEADCHGNYTRYESTLFGPRPVTAQMEWSNKYFNFDNVGAAMLSLFVMAVGDGWADVMYNGMDATGIGKGPSYNHQRQAAIYFIVFIVCGQFFLMNLFVGVLINTFVKTKERETGVQALSEAQIHWMQAQRLLLQTPLEPIIPVPPEDAHIRRFCFRVAMSAHLEILTTIAILMNAVIMSTTHFQEPNNLRNFLQADNVFFVVIFTLEAIVKIIGMTPTFYLRDRWNRFDLLIVLVSLVGLGATGVSGLSVLRLFRIGRLLRLIEKAKGLRTLVHTMIHSLPALWNVSLLLFVIFFMFGIAGVELFGRVNYQPYSGAMLTPHSNFKNVYYALVYLYTISSTEGWADAMRGTMIQPPDCDPEQDNCGTHMWVSTCYFSLFMIVGSSLILNLFVTVVVERYVECEEANSHSDKLQVLDSFRAKWRQEDPRATGMVDARIAIGILESLSQPLWDARRDRILQGKSTQFIETTRALERMCIPVGCQRIDGQKRRFVRFNDIISCLAAKVYQLDRGELYEWYNLQAQRDHRKFAKLGVGFDADQEDPRLQRKVVHRCAAAFDVGKLSPWQLRGPDKYWELHHMHAVDRITERVLARELEKREKLVKRKLEMQAKKAQIQLEILEWDK